MWFIGELWNKLSGKKYFSNIKTKGEDCFCLEKWEFTKMSEILLSILIPITPDRLSTVRPLLTKLGYMLGMMQYVNDEWVLEWENKELGIELIMICDNKTMTIGEKREELYKKSNGIFSVQIDSDDNIADDAISKILEAIKSNPEIPCITFKENCMINGQYYSSNHSIKYDKWQDNFDGYDYVRSPFYKNVIRTDLAKQVPFEHIRWNEDERWSYAIKPLLTDEIHLDEEIYYYIHNSTDPTERYGLDK